MKTDVRKEMLSVRNALSKEQIQTNSERICQCLLPYLKGNVGLYYAYGSEVNLASLLQNKNVSFALPKTFPDHTIRFYQVDEHTNFSVGSYGIREPKDAREVEALDVLLIPLVAFDEQCNRLGHGAGYYDRYLEHFQGLKIGVAHECQKVENVFEEAHDIPLDMIVSEHKIYKNMNF
ncbi:5-formyltetrahydrofolate cyclo-ligase [Amedibacillus sp. YH-ame6]